MTSYCDIAPGHPFHGPYHDRVYGFPVRDDDRLFERLVLEINQAGLSWLTILKKQEAFVAAFEGFEIARVAAFGDEERARLLADAGIIPQPAQGRCGYRERQAYPDAKGVSRLLCRLARRASSEAACGLGEALQGATSSSRAARICREFLLSTGYLEGAHPAGLPGLCRDHEAGAALVSCLTRIRWRSRPTLTQRRSASERMQASITRWISAAHLKSG